MTVPVGRSFVLNFSKGEMLELVDTAFVYSEGSNKVYVEIGNPDYIGWSTGPKALVLCFLKYLCWSKAGCVGKGFEFKHEKGASPENTLADALEYPTWIDNFFGSVPGAAGSDKTGQPSYVTRVLFKPHYGDNRSGKSQYNKVRIVRIAHSFLPPRCVSIFVGRKKLTALKDLENLATVVRELWHPKREAEAEITIKTGIDDLPINRWEHFHWKLAGKQRKPLPTKLYGLNRTSLLVEFDAKRGLWSPGAVLPEYETCRDQVWSKSQEKRLSEGRPVERDDPIWHVERIELIIHDKKERGLRLEVQRACYSDVVATAQDPHLNSAARGTTVQQCLASTWCPGEYSRPFYAAANQLMVLLMVITKDRKVVLARQGAVGAGSKSLWANSVVGHVHGYDDNDNLETPDPTKAASREAMEEIGLVVRPSEIRWMALAVGLKFGSYGLHGEVVCDLTAEEILRDCFPKRTKPSEISEISFVDLKPARVLERLEIKDYTNLCETGLALCLWRRGLAEIVFPPRSDRWAYAD